MPPLLADHYPDRGITYESYQQQEDLRLPELYNVALLELFGFIAIEQGAHSLEFGAS